MTESGKRTLSSAYWWLGLCAGWPRSMRMRVDSCSSTSRWKHISMPSWGHTPTSGSCHHLPQDVAFSVVCPCIKWHQSAIYHQTRALLRDTPTQIIEVHTLGGGRYSLLKSLGDGSSCVLVCLYNVAVLEVHVGLHHLVVGSLLDHGLGQDELLEAAATRACARGSR